MSTRKQYDVIIIGGGLSGLSLACLLGQRGIKLACIDQADPQTKPKDNRTTAVSYGSRKILEKAGIWEHVEQTCPIEHIEILDGTSPVLLDFSSTETEGKSFGWLAENADLKHAMMTRLKTLDTVDHIVPAKVSDFEIHEEKNKACVHLENGDTLEASLLIGADGRQSSMRAWMSLHCGLQTRGWSYKQRAVICNVAHENPHNNVAVEHFWPEGPFAILPLCDNAQGQHRSSVVFTEHGPERKSLMRLSDQEFEQALAERFPERYGTVTMLGKRTAYPLGLVHAAHYIATRMVLVADAAHGIHPIAGQGLNLGFRDLDALDDILDEAFTAQKDLGTQELLERYQRRRRPDNMAMIAVTDGLNRLFSNNIPPVRFLRRAGLRAVAHLHPAKKFFMKQAMGDR